MARSLVDTNVLIYSRDLNEPVKRARAIEVIDQLGASGELALSAQCLNEFSSTSLRRGTPISEVRIAVSRWHDLDKEETRTRANLRKHLTERYDADAPIDLQLAEDWFPLEKEASRHGGR